MERNEFIRKYNTANETIDKNRYYETEKASIDSNPIHIGWGTRNLIIVIEECGELIQELTKIQNGGIDTIGLIEELSDVIMGIDYVKMICDISDSDIEYNPYTLTEIQRKATPINPMLALTELQQQLSKYLRGKCERQNLVDATTKVITTCQCIMKIYNIAQANINKAMNVKLDRLEAFKVANDGKAFQ